jgi:dolichol-phosphate mannosyltransferase
MIDNEKITEPRIAVVIPCYRVKAQVLGVIASIDSLIEVIYVVDDCCPEQSGLFVTENCTDNRIRVMRHNANKGVGGAVMTGYVRAVQDGMDIVVKIDGDGQMDPSLIPNFVAPIAEGWADYTKGNRFYDLTHISAMPPMRLFGNAILSFLAKTSSGYWNIFDPTNGYTAIATSVAAHLPLKKISKRYFFETDILFRLNILRAAVVDIPMDAQYGDEKSNLSIRRVIGEFAIKHLRNTCKRIFYNYLLRDVNVASFELIIGIVLFLFGVIFGTYAWFHSSELGVASAPGTIALAGLPTILGVQFFIAFLSYDIANTPRRSIRRFLPSIVKRKSLNPADITE